MEIQIVNPLTNTGVVVYVSDNCLAEYGVDSWGNASHLNGTTADSWTRCYDWTSVFDDDQWVCLIVKKIVFIPVKLISDDSFAAYKL